MLGLSVDSAREFAMRAHGNLQRAVELYFDNPAGAANSSGAIDTLAEFTKSSVEDTPVGRTLLLDDDTDLRPAGYREFLGAVSVSNCKSAFKTVHLLDSCHRKWAHHHPRHHRRLRMAFYRNVASFSPYSDYVAPFVFLSCRILLQVLSRRTKTWICASLASIF